MVAELLGNYIVRKSDGKKMAYIGVVPMMNKKVMGDYMKVYPPTKFNWVENRKVLSPKTSKIFYKKTKGK